MNTNTNITTISFAEEVTQFVDNFVQTATPEQIDALLAEAGESFYNQIASPELVVPTASCLRVVFEGISEAFHLSASVVQLSGSDFEASGWFIKEPYITASADRQDLALAA